MPIRSAKIGLIPPMGWNHWYTHYLLITDIDIRAAADAMVASGIAEVWKWGHEVGHIWLTGGDLGHLNSQEGDFQRIGGCWIL
jgi:hypothetical protein